MAKLNLANIGAGFGLVTTYNDNSALIEAAIENTLSRDGTGPNQMEAELDMNSFRVINLADGIDPQDAVTKFQLDSVANSGLPPGAIDDILVHDGAMYVTSSVIAEKYITDHEAALTITESQISDLQPYLLVETNDLTAAVVWADIPDANVPESAVTQHEAALTITESQISDLNHVSVINDLTDVFNSAPADRNVLIFSTGNSRYENGVLIAADITGAVGTDGFAVADQVAIFSGSGDIVGDPSFTYNPGTQTFGFGGGSTLFTGSSTYLFQDGNLALDGQSTTIPVLSILQGGINNQSLALSPTAMTFGHDASGLVFTISGNLARWDFETDIRVIDGFGNDHVTFAHDSTDFNATAADAIDFNFVNFSGRIKQDAETLAYVSELGGGGSGVSGLGVWKYRTETGTPPASGQIRFNNVDISAATELYVSETNQGGTDVSTFLDLLLQDGSVLYIQDKTDAANTVLIEIGSSVDSGTFRTYTIASSIEQGTEPGQNDDVILIAVGVPASGSAGDVFKVGSPNDNEVGVWTGDGTIEGDSALTFDAGVLNSTRMRTGFGNASLPAHSFTGETGTGMYRQSAGILGFSMLGTNRWFMRTTHFHANLANGPAMVAEAPSATNAVFAQDFQDLTSGLGGISGFPALIGSGVTLAETISAASGGLRVNNTLTGAGIERVLTTGDLVAAAPVDSVFGRTGAVTALAADYDAFFLTPAEGDAAYGSIADVSANTAKVTNATHTGQVTGATALALDVTAITAQPAAGALVGGDTFIVNDGGTLSEISATDMATFFSSGGGTANDAVQARRTTALLLTAAYVDVTMDATDVETDAAVIEHDAITDRIVAKVTGTYEITYETNIFTATIAPNRSVMAEARVRINDTGVDIPGSDARATSLRDGSINGSVIRPHLGCTFIVNLTANDFVTLQLRKTVLSVDGVFDAEQISFKVTRLI